MSTEMKNLGWSFSLILLLMLCIYPTEEISVTFERQVSSYIGGSSFYSSTDYFDSIGSSDQDRQPFCSKLNAICTRNPCLRCRCKSTKDTFVSYSIGCKNDYFKDSKCIIYDSKIYIPTISTTGFSGSADIQLRSSGKCTITKTFTFSMENSTFFKYNDTAWDIDPDNKNKLWCKVNGKPSCSLQSLLYPASVIKLSIVCDKKGQFSQKCFLYKMPGKIQYDVVLPSPTTTINTTKAKIDRCAVEGYKFDCGYLKTNAIECKNKNCCWKENNSSQPYCFYKDGYCDSTQNIKCGQNGIKVDGCVSLGCCWNNTECFHPKGYATTTSLPTTGTTTQTITKRTTTTAATTIIPTTKAKSDGCTVDYKFDCGFLGINKTECGKKTNCCWKKNDFHQPYCFYKDGYCDLTQKIQCGNDVKDKDKCVSLGCCWKDSCFHPKGYFTTTSLPTSTSKQTTTTAATTATKTTTITTSPTTTASVTGQYTSTSTKTTILKTTKETKANTKATVLSTLPGQNETVAYVIEKKKSFVETMFLPIILPILAAVILLSFVIYVLAIYYRKRRTASKIKRGSTAVLYNAHQNGLEYATINEHNQKDDSQYADVTFNQQRDNIYSVAKVEDNAYYSSSKPSDTAANNSILPKPTESANFESENLYYDSQLNCTNGDITQNVIYESEPMGNAVQNLIYESEPTGNATHQNSIYESEPMGTAAENSIYEIEPIERENMLQSNDINDQTNNTYEDPCETREALAIGQDNEGLNQLYAEVFKNQKENS